MKRKTSHIRLATALAAFLGGPGLFLLQSSWTTPPGSRTEPERGRNEQFRVELFSIGDDAAFGRAPGIARLADALIRGGDRKAAEWWIRHGAAQLKGAAFMLYYGDFLRGENTPSALLLSDYWYARAEAAVPPNPTAEQELFRKTAAERRKTLREDRTR